MTFFISQTYSAPGEKIIESCLTYLLRNLQYCDPNDFFKFGKLMWTFSYMCCLQNSHRKYHTTSDQANKQITKDG